jgi:hypothetical protein
MKPSQNFDAFVQAHVVAALTKRGEGDPSPPQAPRVLDLHFQLRNLRIAAELDYFAQTGRLTDLYDDAGNPRAEAIQYHDLIEKARMIVSESRDPAGSLAAFRTLMQTRSGNGPVMLADVDVSNLTARDMNTFLKGSARKSR